MSNEMNTLRIFRQELYDEGILSDNDTIGSDDHTLLCVYPIYPM